MGIHHRYLNIPYPLQIDIELVPDNGHPTVRATSPSWPNLLGRGHDLNEAIDDLLPQISDQNRPKASCVAALRAAGHSDSTIAAWSTSITGYRLWALRNDGTEAVERLAAYAKKDVAPAAACHFIAIGLGPESAGTLHTKGITPHEAAPYLRQLGDFWADYYDEPVPCIIAQNERDLVQWIMSEFDPEVAAYYEQAFANPSVARTWHATVTKHEISAEDLRDIVLAGFTPEAVDESAGRDNSGTFHPAESARIMLAFRRAAAQPAGDPWAPPF